MITHFAGGDLQVLGGSRQAAMAQQQLNGPNVGPGFQQMNGKTVAPMPSSA